MDMVQCEYVLNTIVMARFMVRLDSPNYPEWTAICGLEMTAMQNDGDHDIGCHAIVHAS